MITRLLKKQVQKQLKVFPSVSIIGPRQSGKTTLAKMLDGHYFDLEKDGDRLKLEVGWDQIIHGEALVIFDEAQVMPEIFSRLRSAIDEFRKKNGRFLLLGSVSPSLMKQIGESLTGRLAICEMTPFLAKEILPKNWDHLWHFGGYPDGGILNAAQFPEWQINYLDLLTQRDFPEWGLNAKPILTKRLLHMLSAVNGQLWNASQIGKSLGISYHTVNDYVDFLENVFLIRRLPAYSTNFKKRQVKSSKIYWRDSGLLHALLGMSSNDDLFLKPWIGASWEGWIIENILSDLKIRGKSFNAFHFRTSNQDEIDLVIEFSGKLWAIEIKLTASPSVKDLNKLKKNAQLINADFCALISKTAHPIHDNHQASTNLKSFLDWLAEF